jgi:cytochrome oxidase Cu insertion factor (SCO1/SenC/PrrC family)
MRFAAVLALLSAALPALAGPPAPRKSPEFTITDANGKESLLSTYRGKVVVIGFIYTTCPHCQAFSVVLEKLYKELGPRGFQPIDIAWNDNAKLMITNFAQQFGVTFPIAWSTYEPIMSYMQFSIMDRPVVPLVVVIDRKGMIRAQSPPGGDANLQDEAKLREMIETLLKEPAGTSARK